MGHVGTHSPWDHKELGMTEQLTHTHTSKSQGEVWVCTVSHFPRLQRGEIFLTIPVFQEHKAQYKVQHCHSQSGY